MNTKKNIIIFLVCLLPFLGSCEDFLNVKVNGEISSDIWNNAELAMYYTNKIHALCLPGFGGTSVSDVLNPTRNSDEVIDNTDIILGTLTSGQIGTYSADNYVPIRYINIAFDELKSSSLTGEARDYVEGQLYFHRAWQHWRMVLIHGGVPYMKDVIGYDTDEALRNAPRNTTSECIKYIQDDLEEAIRLLPSEWEDKYWGRVTNAAAAAMLGRILVYYASPQFTPDQNSAEARARWEAAYAANIRARDICIAGGYGLLDCSTAVTEEWPAKADINKIFLTSGKSGNPEPLFFRVYGSVDTHSWEQNVRPGALTGSTSTLPLLPSLKLAKAFPNADGTPYTGSDTDPYYWRDRDSRFYSTITYNGAYYPYAGNSSYRQWTYENGDPSPAPSRTSFYIRKMLNPATTDYTKTATNWIELRYAEVLLNLAEAAYETNNPEVMDCLGQIRRRAGIPEGSDYYGLRNSDWTELELIMNERFIEFAFEGKRFYDLRRRNMFTEDLGPNIKALNGGVKSTWGLEIELSSRAPGNFAQNRDQMSMEEVTQYMDLYTINMPPYPARIDYKCYPTLQELSSVTTGNYNFFDIQEGIINRNPLIRQVLGWPGGEFNPFE